MFNQGPCPGKPPYLGSHTEPSRWSPHSCRCNAKARAVIRPNRAGRGAASGALHGFLGCTSFRGGVVSLSAERISGERKKL